MATCTVCSLLPDRLRWALSVVACLAVGQAAPALACPDCAVGRAARAQLWTESFAYNLMVLLLPFAFVVAASMLAEHTGSTPDREQRGKP